MDSSKVETNEAVKEDPLVDSTTKKVAKKRRKSEQVIEELTTTEEQLKKVDEMLRSSMKDAPNFLDEKTCTTIYIPVDDGEIRVSHIKPENPVSKRPVVFIPGWGTIPDVSQDFYEVIYELVEFYYVETREKGTSKLNKKKAKMTVNQKAKDIQDIIKYLELDKDDFLLIGSCWGGAIILQGLLDGTIKAPTIITFDPMHKLWFFRSFSKYVAPFLPVFLIRIIKPILKFFALFGMKEKTQRNRVEKIVASAEPWKWKRAAIAAGDFELFGKLSRIKEEVLVFNGTKDKIHDQKDYPAMAKELPNGRFFFMKTDESTREFLVGFVTREFSKIKAEEGIPPSLREFEKELKREKKGLGAKE